MTQRAFWLGQTQQPPASAVKVMGDDFALIKASPKAVAMFYSPGCPYSRKFMPIYQAVSSQYPDVLFATVNVDQYVQQAGVNKVQMLPTVVFFVNGQAVGRIDGVQEQSDFLAEMQKAFSGTPASAATSTTPSARSGTLVGIEPTGSVVPYVVGGVVGVGILAAAAYLIFGK